MPSSSVNCKSFLLFGTATHSLTLTALKSDLLNVSKSTSSSNKGSIFTFEKSIFSSTVAFWLQFSASSLLASLFSLTGLSKLFIVGNNKTSLIAAAFVSNIHILSIPNPIPPVGGIPISSAFIKSSSVVLASSSPSANNSS